MLAETRTGLQFSSDGAVNIQRATRSGALVTADGHARYTEAVARGGNFFTAANIATQALSVASVTATGMILTNPVGSGKIISLVEINVALASLPAGQSALILAGATSAVLGTVTQTTPLVPRQAIIGGGSALTPVGLVASAATLPTGGNTILGVLGGAPAATVAGSTAFPPFIRANLDGLFCLAPGAFISLQALTTAITVVSSIIWEEIPL
jgi:hypothetical protein